MINKEPKHESVERALATAPSLAIGGPTRLECAIVLQARFGVHTVDFNEEHADVATGAFHRFGKGRHPATLNMGDCLTYAAARVLRQQLLCVGEDFPQTDLELVSLE